MGMQRILLVEDSKLTRDLLVGLLNDGDRRAVVGAVETEEEAFQFLASTPPDIAIIDVALKAGSGIGLLTRIRTLPEPRPVSIVYTNNYDRTLHELCRRLGATAVLSKRGDLTDLLDAVENNDHD